MTYYRHPFLHIGRTKARHDSLKQFLKTNQYIEAPVSIDNADYLFALAYHKARTKQDDELADRVGQSYLEHMTNKLKFYEALADSLFSRNINHVLLLHANWLNAEYLDELAEVYVRNGYEFVSLSEALKDPAYQSEITQYGPWGISWIDRWALSQGKSSSFFKGDPEVPPFIKELNQRN